MARINQRLILLVTLLVSHTESSPFPQLALKTLLLEDLIPFNPSFYPDGLSVQWVSDTEFIRREPEIGILKYNAVNHSFVTVLNKPELIQLSNYSLVTFSNDGKYVLLTRHLQKVYRYSTVAEYYVYNTENKSLKAIGNGLLQVVVWSSNASLAYVQENNVYYVPDVAQPETVVMLTTEGVPGEVYFGATDWIYEEEVFNAAEALWFSPNGTYLAVASFNDTNVESAIYPYYGNESDPNNQYPELVEFKYPKAGRVNPVVGLRVFKLDDINSKARRIPAPVDVVGVDHILGRVDWASDQNLVVLWLTRRQSVSILVNCDLKQDECSLVREQTEPNGWIDISQPFFNKNGTKLVEIQHLYDGDARFPHVGRFDFKTLTTEDLSSGNSSVTEILGWNQGTDTIYYIAAPGHMPWLRQLWATEADGTVRCISCKEPACQCVSAAFSPGASFGVVTCSATNVAPKVFFYSCVDDTMKLVKDNARLNKKLSEYKLPMPLFNMIYLEKEHTLANIKLLLPPDIKEGEKYPMIVRVYAGPGTTRVKDNFDLEYYTLYLAANRSFIVAAIDVRGSGVLGTEAMHAVNDALGTVEITDTLAAIEVLIGMYNFIDPKRIGVWGWSYGGYATTMMLIKDEKKLITCGAAVAPVTSWLYYDTIYTERYMDTPQANPIGYQQSDLLAATEKLRGRKYLLVHGTGDDNVHYQHSLQLAKKLQHEDIEFQQVSYTDENHSLMGVSRHFYHTLDRFWTDCFHL
ncbi:venom dipeptidyl peptidase 4-like [Achroia grisella]|uniref:venom dipeptidyl peptidase 4-like n=1 Tax=Achroia grisella TaxID=688607 RepID=UPI0027D26599|nr:venom dipeptidyl peptidase 4-like [Achroia grisella]